MISGPGKIGDRYQALARASRSFAREGERLGAMRSPFDSFDFAADGKARNLWMRQELKDSAIWKSTVMDATGQNSKLNSKFNLKLKSVQLA